MPNNDDCQPTGVDLEVLSRDIQAISNADAVAAFFARLGYNTNARLKQTPANLGMAAEGTSRPIRNVELIADHESFLQVYLFELSSVTVTHTRALARAFKNRVGDQLLVLTSDYETLDFVLLEKYLPADEDGATPMTQKQVSRRPRVLTVNRRNASPVQLRVLRRFTWTELDPFAQYDKLLSAYSVADWSEEYFNNHALFSDYFLKERLPDEPQWREQSKPAYMTLKSLYRNAPTQFAQTDFPVLVRQLFEPIFGHLGFAMVRPPKGDDPKALPHFLLQSPGGGPTLATCLAYRWNRNLDGKDEKDPERAAENPSATVVSLLERGESRWSIVTNGKLWRLYSAEAHSRATNYYEIDLQEILAEAGSAASSPGDAFPFFWLLFRQDAFVEQETDWDGTRVRLSFLDLLLRQSQQYAKVLGENLKRRVFEDVFPQLAQGFITFVRSQEGAQAAFSEARLASIFQGTLTLLYRLLFLLYAESRNLLPVREIRGYFEASLIRLKQEVADRAGDIDDERWDKLRHAYREDSFDLYERLNRLFRIIDQGDPSVNVPVYNGGLFLLDPQEDDPTQEAVNARFLGEHRVPDTHLAMAIDLLARDVDSKKHSLVMIDYKTLGVRHLGSIYEGLLEFKIRIADRKLAITKQDGNEIYTPFSGLAERQQLRAEREGRTVKKGRVYLENDKHERKASGSYYTPDHIVQYIVENTVGPALKAKFDALRPKLRDAQVARRAFLQKQEALKKMGLRPEPDMKADLIGQDVADEVFDCKVLDPAMGSGHFLVEAVDFITDKTLDFLSAFPSNPVYVYLDRMRLTILQEMEQKGITIDEKKLTDVNLLKRHVLKRCIYGVDLNPMAVELAKVSLWLDCFTLGAPLSFLDHHLRCGNSLIGATVCEVENALSDQSGTQFGLFETRFPGLLSAVDAMRQVGELSDITTSQIGESRAQYRKAEGLLAPLQRWLDVYTSQWFGNGVEGKRRRGAAPPLPIALTFLKDHAAQVFLMADDSDAFMISLRGLPTVLRGIADQALRSAEERAFFHWELEFPEVFYGPRPGTRRTIERIEGGGFDVIVGNPPWVATKQIPEILRQYFWSTQRTLLIEEMDYYELFIALSSTLLTSGGKLGFIIPNTWYTNRAFENLRRDVIFGMFHPDSLIDYPYRFFPFPEVNKETCILVLTRSSVTETFSTSIVNKLELLKHPVLDGRFSLGQKSIPAILKRPQAMLFLRESKLTETLDQADTRLGRLVEAHKGWMSIPKQTRTRLHLYKQELFTPEELQLDPELRKLCRPCARGEDTQHFCFLRDSDQSALVYVNAQDMDPETASWQLRSKVICQRITGQNSRRFIAAVDEDGEYVAHPSTNLLFFRGNLSAGNLLRLAGLLNADCINEYYKTLFGETNTNITADVLDFLPVPNDFFELNNEAGQAVERHVGQMMRSGGARAIAELQVSATFACINQIIENAFGVGKE